MLKKMKSVKKRGNTRFFFKGNRNEFTNAPMGTVVDNSIVKNPGLVAGKN